MGSATVYAGNNFQSVCNRLNGSTLNGGSNQENHLPVGYSSSTDSRWRAIVKFPNIAASIPVGAKIVKAEVWIKTTGSTVHVSKGSNARMKISRVVQSENPAFSGGSGEGWYTSADPAGFELSTTGTLTFPAEGDPGDGVVKKYDITDFVEFWLPANYLKRDGSPCSNGTNNGIEIKSYDENSNTRTSEFWSTRGGYEPRLVVTYTTEDPPDAATSLTPSGDLTTAPTELGATFSGTTAKARWKLGTADGTWDILETAYLSTALGAQTYDVSGIDFSSYVGQTIYFKVDTQNSIGDAVGSAVQTFYILPIPTATIEHPGAGGRCHVHNLASLAVWTGSEAKPRVEVGYSHPTGVAAQAIEVRINGGTAHSFSVNTPSGGTAVLDIDEAVARNTDFTIEARAQGGGGQWSDWTSAVTARVNWSQVVLPFTPGATSSDFVARHAALAGGARTQVAYAYRVAAGSWKSSPGQLPDGTTSAEMLVRLSTSDAAQSPSLADLEVEWQTSPPPAPDFWEAVNADLSLDPEVRRFGVHSLKVLPDGGGQVRVRNTVTLVVSPNTQYTISVYVNTLGQTLSGDLVLGYEDANGVLTLLTDVDAITDDSTGQGKEDWQRLFGTFTTAPGMTELKAVLVADAAVTEEFRVDSMQLESGAVASSWRPGALGPAVILDVGGVAIDGQAGGIFRARGANGPVVTLGDDGLEVDGEPYITADALPPTHVAPVRHVYTASTTWAKPDGLLYIEVELVGAGGGGGAAQATGSSEASAGGGGGAGGYAKKLLTAAQLASASGATITVGAAGTGSAGSAGNAGTASSFAATGIPATITGNGGGGGALGTNGSGATIHSGGTGGTASGGDINIDGQDGAMGGRFSFSGVTSARPITSNDGADSPLGTGGMSYANGAGAAGTGYGSGGGGAINNVSQSGHTGGSGKGGCVIVTEHYA